MTRNIERQNISYPTGRYLILEGKRHIADGDIQGLFRQLHRNPEGFRERLEGFDDVITKINKLKAVPDLDSFFFPKLSALNTILPADEGLPTLHELSYAPDQARRWNVDISLLVTEVFQDIGQDIFIDQQNLSPEVMENPEIFASIMVKKWYPHLIGKIYHSTLEEKGVSQQAVEIAVEEAINEVTQRYFPDLETSPNLGLWKRHSQKRPRPAIDVLLEEDDLTRAMFVNKLFENDVRAEEIVDLIRRFKNPVAVDFHYTLATGGHPPETNPDAPYFLSLADYGATIFIISGTKNAVELRQELVDAGLYDPRFIIMGFINWIGFTDWGKSNPLVRKLRDQFKNDVALYKDRHYKDRELRGLPFTKRLAVLFGYREIEVPIVDDLYMTVFQNPEMDGHLVKPWHFKMRSAHTDPPLEEYTLVQSANRIADRYGLAIPSM